MTTNTDQPTAAVAITAELVMAYLMRNALPASELAGLITSTHAAIVGLSAPPAEPEADHTVTHAQIRKSITPDYLVSFIDGKQYKALKRHLRKHGMTPEEYKAKYGLPADYPIVASTYAAKRSELAKSSGLGQIRRKRKLQAVA